MNSARLVDSPTLGYVKLVAASYSDIKKRYQSCHLTLYKKVNIFLLIVLFICSSYHVVNNIDVVRDAAHVITPLHVHPLWISSSQNGNVGVSLCQIKRVQLLDIIYTFVPFVSLYINIAAVGLTGSIPLWMDSRSDILSLNPGAKFSGLIATKH